MIFLFSTMMSRLAVGSTQAPVRWTLRTLPVKGVKRRLISLLTGGGGGGVLTFRDKLPFAFRITQVSGY